MLARRYPPPVGTPAWEADRAQALRAVVGSPPPTTAAGDGPLHILRPRRPEDGPLDATALCGDRGPFWCWGLRGGNRFDGALWRDPSPRVPVCRECARMWRWAHSLPRRKRSADDAR